MSAGKYLKDSKDLKGLLQKQVAEHLGISAQFYGRVEKGEVELPPKLVKKCCKYVGADVSCYLEFRVEEYSNRLKREIRNGEK